MDTAEVARATDTQEAAEAEKVEAELDTRVQAKVAADKVVDKAVVEAATETGQVRMHDPSWIPAPSSVLLNGTDLALPGL